MNKLIVVIAGCASAAALAAGCGGGGSSDSTAAATKPAADAARAASTRLAIDYRGTDRPLPASAPEPQPNKNIWVIACARAAEGCAIPANAIKEAGTKIGWKVTIFDGAFDPTTQSNGIRSAVADHADAIVLIAVDCPAVSTALKQAKAAKIKIYGDFSLDCNEGAGGQPMLDGSAVFGKAAHAVQRLPA
jgi:ribose transport system substrate-binding protein